MSEKSFTLDELCTLTDLTKRTVRYYMQMGLVERPIGEPQRHAPAPEQTVAAMHPVGHPGQQRHPRLP